MVEGGGSGGRREAVMWVVGTASDWSRSPSDGGGCVTVTECRLDGFFETGGSR